MVAIAQDDRPVLRTAPPRPRLTHGQRVEIYQKTKNWDEPDKMTLENVALWAANRFRLTRLPCHRVISRILKHGEELLALQERDPLVKNRKRRTLKQTDLLNEAIMARLRSMNPTHVHTKTIIAIAKEEVERLGIPVDKRPRFSNGWLSAFNKRNGIRFRKPR